MVGNYRFSKIIEVDELAILKKNWLDSLTSPQDGMWDSFRDGAEDWGIFENGEMIGYGSKGEGNELLQFYILPTHLWKGEDIFKDFIDLLQIKTGIVGTNNLVYLSFALVFVKDLAIHTYLFRNTYEIFVEEKEGELKSCEESDLVRIVKFCYISMGAPKEWLAKYIGTLIARREMFFLEHKNEIIGTCEVRRSKTAPKFADIGMVVSPSYRRQGYGTYLLHKAKEIALERGKIPICSCEKDNIGSKKSIHNCGFVSMNQLLRVSFK